MKEKANQKKFVSYKKIKKTNQLGSDKDTSNDQAKTYAVSLSKLKRARPKGPLVLLSLNEMEAGQLDSPEALERKPIIACWKYLIKAFPNTFSISNPKPLKIGIHYHICRNNTKISMEAVCSVLSSYTGMRRYREALCTHSVRIGLDGEPAGKVSVEQVATVQKLLNAESVDDKVA